MPYVTKGDLNTKARDNEKIFAEIRIGDHISLVGGRNVWWVVHEMRPFKALPSLLLVEARNKGSNRPQSAVQFKEIQPMHTIGCIVKRPTITPNGESHIIFTMPMPNKRHAIDALHEIVSQKVGFSHLDENPIDAKENHIKIMQRFSHVEVWLRNKQVLIEGRDALARLSPEASVHGRKWLRIGRALRVLSKGADDLLPVSETSHLFMIP